MTKKKESIAGISLAGVAAMVLFGSGCATQYGILDVQMPVARNPAEGKAVAIVRVTDRREFGHITRMSSDSSTPQLRDEDFGNAAIRARAIACKPSDFRNGLSGNYLLPEGRTVEDLVREALTRALRETGYRVVDPADAARANATPIEVDIEHFWCGFTSELLKRVMLSIALPFDCKVKITGDIAPFKNGDTVEEKMTLHSQAKGFDRPLMNTIVKGLDEFVKEVKLRLAASLPPEKVSVQSDDTAEKLKKIEKLRKDGLITEEEYQQKRKAILDKL